MKHRYRANDFASVAALAHNLNTTPPEAYPQALGLIYFHRLMTPAVRAWPLDWIAQAMVNLLRWRLGKPGLQMLVAKMQKRDPDMVRRWMAEAVDHCMNGSDLEDEGSIGGWSQREIDLLVADLTFSRDADEEALAKRLYGEFVLSRPRVPRLPAWEELSPEECEPWLNHAFWRMLHK